MDWVFLIFLVPLVLIPLVFLTGFAGCTFHGGAASGGDNGTPPPAAPSNLAATAVSSSEIDLTWTDNATNTTAFRIDRSENGAPPVSLTVNPVSGMQQTLDDSGLSEATTYQYQVFAKVVDLTSDGSNMASATTFAVAYNIPLTTDDPGWEGNTIVQRIATGQLSNDGTKVRLTLRGSSTANLVINNVAISQPAVGMQEWDSAADLVEVLFGGASGVTIAANTASISDVTNYTLDSGKDLLVAFNISHDRRFCSSRGCRRIHHVLEEEYSGSHRPKPDRQLYKPPSPGLPCRENRGARLT